MEGMSNFAGANAMLQMSNYGNIPQQVVPPQQQQQQQQQQNSQSEMTPKKAVFERLKKRINSYRKRQTETIPRFEQTFNGICEQQSAETSLLQKKFLESKAKRVAKKVDKKQGEVIGGVGVSKKRPAPDDLENEPDLIPPSSKMPPNQQQQQQQPPQMDNMKFQVEIVQQLEFTTSAVNMQAQQISTNVTVKATANGIPQEMKPKMSEMNKMQHQHQQIPPQEMLQDFKQEPDNEFADLDFGGIANFMANDENELKKLFSNISDVFDQSDLFDDSQAIKIKQEPMMKQQMPQMPMQQQQFNQFPPQYVMPEAMQMQKPQMMQQQPMRMYPQQAPMQQMQPDITPAAQTLKNMAQQHQVKSSMAMNYMRPPINQQMQPQLQRMPYQQQQPPPQPQNPQQQPPPQQQQSYNDFNQYTNPMSMKSQMQMPFTADMIKQELIMQQQPMMKPMMSQMMHDEQKMQNFQQNFQPTPPQQQQPPFMPQNQQRNFPPQNSMNIHMKQTQMMHIQQQGGGGGGQMGNIQMQGAQHMGMTMNDGNFNMQQQQNMYFNAQQQQQQPQGPQYGNAAMQMQQKRLMSQQPHLHHPQGGGSQMPHMNEGPTNTYNMMQSQSMSFTQ